MSVSDALMNPEVRKHVEAIYKSRTEAAIVSTGGGARALSWLLSVPGASRTILDIHVPYSEGSLVELLGKSPINFVSADTSRRLAEIAYLKAIRLGSGGSVIGVGSTSAISTDREKKGRHRCFVSVITDDCVVTHSIEFIKGVRDRDGEDEICSKVLIRAFADACRVPFELTISLDARERVDVVSSPTRDVVVQLLDGVVPALTMHSDGEIEPGTPNCVGVLAGSFNPLHDAHQDLAVVASTLLGGDVCFEISYVNVDKPPMNQFEIKQRMMQFMDKGVVVVSNAPVFHKKARLFPGRVFVVGWDTVTRLISPVYYGGDFSEMIESLSEIRGLGCKFLVAGRLEGKVFRTLEDIKVPCKFTDMFTAISESVFRSDISSTEIRSSMGQHER